MNVGSGDAELCIQRQTTALDGPDVDEQRDNSARAGRHTETACVGYN